MIWIDNDTDEFMCVVAVVNRCWWRWWNILHQNLFGSIREIVCTVSGCVWTFSMCNKYKPLWSGVSIFLIMDGILQTHLSSARAHHGNHWDENVCVFSAVVEWCAFFKYSGKRSHYCKSLMCLKMKLNAWENFVRRTCMPKNFRLLQFPFSNSTKFSNLFIARKTSGREAAAINKFAYTSLMTVVLRTVIVLL